MCYGFVNVFERGCGGGVCVLWFCECVINGGVVCVSYGFVNVFGSGVRRLTIRPKHSSQGVGRKKGVLGLTLVTMLVGVGLMGGGGCVVII